MSTWTPARVKTLKTLWNQGQSGTQIARQLGAGLTRCAVIAKLDRLGLKRGKPTPPDRVAVIAKTPAPFRIGCDGVRVFPQPPNRPLGNLASPQSDVSSPNAKVYTERGFGECAYPVSGEGETTLSCCNAIRKGPYCDPHRQLVYEPKAKSKLNPGMARDGGRRRDPVNGMPGMAA